MAGNNINEEIVSLKARSDIKVKVITSSGEISHILTVEVSDSNIVLKIQIPVLYPNSSPSVIARKSKSICPQLTEKLTTFCNDNNGKPVLNQLIDLTVANVGEEEFVIDANSVENKKPSEWEGSTAKPKKSKKVKIRTVESKHKGKKEPMKTASDVVNRFQWDEAIEKDDITIGYLDRFRGIVEKPWMAFSWEDISSVDYYTFVIPRHRIAYFKWKTVKVWEKSTRMDNVFGSTGSNTTIYDVMENYVAPEVVPPPAPVPVVENNAAGDAGDGDDDFSDSDSDDDVMVTIRREEFDRQSSVALSESESDPEMEVSGARNREYWEDKCRPNFFVCVRVQNPEIVSLVNRIQDDVTAGEPRLMDCCIPENMLHITLLTLRLNDAEEVSSCLEILHQSRDELLNSVPRTPLTLRGTGCFFGRVLYARAEAQQEFFRFVEHLRAVVCAAGLRIMDQHEFVAHMTLMKTNRPASRAMGTRLISPHLYAGTEDMYFGEQQLDSIYLCSMEKERGPEGFYISPGAVNFERDIFN